MDPAVRRRIGQGVEDLEPGRPATERTVTGTIGREQPGLRPGGAPGSSDREPLAELHLAGVLVPPAGPGRFRIPHLDRPLLKVFLRYTKFPFPVGKA
jgi:hypothetical protein